MAVCRKPRLRCLSHSNHVVGQVTSLSDSTFLSRDLVVLSHQLIDYLLTGYPVRTQNAKPSSTSHGPYFVRSILCDFGIGSFQYGPVRQLINR